MDLSGCSWQCLYEGLKYLFVSKSPSVVMEELEILGRRGGNICNVEYNMNIGSF